MPVHEYTYDAFAMQQTTESKQLILFAALAPEIGKWAGVPQRERLDEGETVGFQRQENPSRVRELAGFFDEGKNVVQNPLLAAIQDDTVVEFKHDESSQNFGKLTIRTDDLGSLTLLELLRRVVSRLEHRVPELQEQPHDEARFLELMAEAGVAHELKTPTPPSDDFLAEEEADTETEAEDVADVGSVLLTEETQLVDFYLELSYRVRILERVHTDEDPDEILGFSKDAMISYLQPVVLVDGQHRLLGAIASARRSADSEAGRQEIVDAMTAGASPDDAHELVVNKYARLLPVSLLLDDSPREHVFQFVVVNQKATPMSSALLGTIVSTSLSRNELEPVATRLRNAGIRLEDSQAVAYLSRSAESPFRGYIQTGIAGDGNGLLPWNVLNGLSSIFRELKGGILYHQTNDFAAKWRRTGLQNSALVEAGVDEQEKYDIWRAADGPWRDVFIRFFTLVRDRFGDEDPAAHNAWGNTKSNLFNKISLTILAADFFQFLDERRMTLNSANDVNIAFADWLDGVNPTYFARDWQMDGLKKDQGPVKKKWAALWFEYRKNPIRMPRFESFRP